MDQFSFQAGINECLKSCMENPITKGPTPRWQRKLQAQSRGVPLSPVNIGNQSKRKLSSTTPGTSKNKNPPTKKTPGKPPSNTNSAGTSCDRFIANRALMDMDRCHHILMKENDEDVKPEDESGAEDETARWKNNLGVPEGRILAHKQKAPSSEYHMNKVLFSQDKSKSAKWKSSRHIPDAPERILDAPGVTNDYYLDLLDWGNNNCLAVALSGAVYVWNASTAQTDQLFQLEDETIVTSLSWIKEGNILAVGLDNGTVELWDTAGLKRVRSMPGHAGRVGSLAWNSYILSSGSRTGAIHQHDVRVPNHHIASLLHHSQEICGLDWSPDGNLLASGGNDDTLNIWDVNLQSSGEITEPLHSLEHHVAAVKAVAFCPWQPHILASGAGTTDRHIRVWNARTGACLQSVDTGSQVSGLVWSEEHKEIISSHGYSDNQLSIWKYPSMHKVKELTGHTSRIISITQSADHSMVASMGADETVRVWKCLAFEQKKSKAKARSAGMQHSMQASCIR